MAAKELRFCWVQHSLAFRFGRSRVRQIWHTHRGRMRNGSVRSVMCVGVGFEKLG